MKFSDKLEFDNISSQDVIDFNEQLGEGVNVKTIEDLQKVVRGVNLGI
jgi:hypothetical protein